ncbi:MAG TPA: flagellar basal body L-ring protein FlgH [Gammaproteobacteria bacterium]|nr:flagellar basal body L-ring protein FlgH [Gammaproteobacteria bacterium]
MKATRILLCLGLVASMGLQQGCGITFKPRKQNFEPAKPRVSSLPRKDNGAIYQEGMMVGWFQNVTAHAVGDILTIKLLENTNASTSSNTNTSKDQSVEMPGPTLAGQKVTNKDGVEILENNLEAGREFSGQGTSAMNSTFSGTITVVVSDVQPNGNLVVKGKKLVILNQSEEMIQFSGIVRPLDIAPDNTVPSNRVANVYVAYAGDGALSSANSMGPLARFFQSGVWPY